MKENLLEIQENIKDAAKKSGRFAEDITLIGVSKTVPVEIITEAYQLGVKHFGENKVQEFLPKYEVFPEPAWHMIGHLQTNKVKFIIDKVKLIHSVDSFKLAHEIDKRAKQKNIKMDILVEINIAGEDTKQGIPPQNTDSFIEQMYQFPNISVKGLMCIAPYVEKSEENRVYFEKMYRLFVDIKAKRAYSTNMRILSMGMSGDYKVAIEEGATMVRIGTSLFGYREQSIKM